MHVILGARLQELKLREKEKERYILLHSAGEGLADSEPSKSKLASSRDFSR